MTTDARPDRDETRAAAERAARTSYGRLVAYLARRVRDIAAAEDALAEAFARALERWPEEGVPSAPEAWLFRVAARKLVDGARNAAVRGRPDVVSAIAEASRAAEAEAGGEPEGISDERLRLMFVCAHPAIESSVRPALMLQVVLGLDAKAIASAFLVSTDTMTKRLVRAKAKIRASGIRFEDPAPEDLAPRLRAVLEAIYAAYALAQGGTRDGEERDELREEALMLAEVVAEHLPADAEALGFLALVDFCEARRPASLGDDGALVTLLDQDPARWDRARIERGLRALSRAAQLGVPGPFQLEAAIQAAHCWRARSGVVPWAEIAALYKELVARWPTVGAHVGMAVAVAHARGPREGLDLLARLDPAVVVDHAPFWVASSHLHAMDGQGDAARRALERALALTHHPRSRAHLEEKLRAARAAGAAAATR